MTKGTPVTQVDMRRLSDGVKVSERWRTTEMVELAYVEDRPYTYLYSDGDDQVELAVDFENVALADGGGDDLRHGFYPWD